MNNFKKSVLDHFQDDKKFQERFLKNNGRDLINEYKEEISRPEYHDILDRIGNRLRYDEYNYICFLHHNDLDGLSSASVVYREIENQFTNLRFSTSFTKAADHIITESIKWNYNAKELSNNIIPRIKENVSLLKQIWSRLEGPDSVINTLVVMTDLSFDKLENLESVLDLFDDAIWIDHHNTSLSVLNEYKKKYPNNSSLFYYVNTKECATLHAYCIMNAWEWIVNKYDTEHINNGLEYSALVSVYDLKQDKTYIPITYYLASSLNQLFWDFNPQTAFDFFFSDIYDPYSRYYQNLLIKLEDGAKFLELDKKKKELLFIKDYEYKTELDLIGLNKEFEEDKIITMKNFKEGEIENVNIKMLYGFGNSNRFIYANKDDKNIIYGIIKYSPDNANFVLSTYTDDVDIQKGINLGEVWKFYGIGGGHPGASGCSLPVHVVEALSSLFEYYVDGDIHCSYYICDYYRLNGIYDTDLIFGSCIQIFNKVGRVFRFLEYVTKKDNVLKPFTYLLKYVKNMNQPKYETSRDIRYDGNISKAVYVFSVLIAIYIVLKYCKKQ